MVSTLVLSLFSTDLTAASPPLFSRLRRSSKIDSVSPSITQIFAIKISATLRSLHTSASAIATLDDSDDCNGTFRKPYSLFPCGDLSSAAVFRSRLLQSSKARSQLDFFSSDDDEE
ncbi:hypothetical protein L1887_37826 [Cichorium endivia]|nr:hypothetical protein L1887_37826 [Cichorium endivia]